MLDTDSEDFDNSDKDPDFVVPVSNGKDETQITVENGEFEEPCASSVIQSSVSEDWPTIAHQLKKNFRFL